MGSEGFADFDCTGFQAVHGMLNLTVAERGGADDERAVGDSFGEGGEFFGLLHDGGGADGGAGFAESEVVGLDDTEVEESEVAHGASGGAEVEWVAGADQNNTEVGCREQTIILRRGRLAWIGKRCG